MYFGGVASGASVSAAVRLVLISGGGDTTHAAGKSSRSSVSSDLLSDSLDKM